MSYHYSLYAAIRDTSTLILVLDFKKFNYSPGDTHRVWVQYLGKNAEMTRKKEIKIKFLVLKWIGSKLLHIDLKNFFGKEFKMGLRERVYEENKDKKYSSASGAI